MGIFDGYQFGDSPQGGLIDRLFAQLGVQNQYQPSQGFAPNPMDAQAAIPQQQNAPIAVGDYMMPRIGGGFPGYPAHDPATGATVQPNQPSPLDNAQWPYGPNGAPSQANAMQPRPSMLLDSVPHGRMAVRQAMQQPMAPQQPQQPMQQQNALPAAVQPYAQPQGGFGGAARGFVANAQNGPLGMLMGGIGGAMGMQDPAQEQANRTAAATYRELVPILGEHKATLAILNPTLGQKMVETALAGKQYTFATTPDGTVIRQDAHAGTAEPVYQAGLKPTFGVIGEEDGKKTYGWTDPSKRTVTPYKAEGADDEDRKTVNGPDGKPIPIPPGVDRKTFVNEVSRANAKAAAGELTEAQAKSTIYASKMELAEKNLKGLDDQYTSTLGAGGYMRGTEYVPGGNTLQSQNYQKYKQARDNYITALLRQESGAAIGTSEFNRYEKELFPQPGDGPDVVKQKREARRIATEGMKKGAGPGYKTPNFDGGGGAGDTKADPLGIR
jgi:hypothetical protein